MKILQVCSAETLGGGERHVIDLTRALIERGHELHLAVRKNNALRAELKNFPIKWHEIPLRNALDVFSARTIAKIIRAENIEVLHAHVARDYTICGFAAKLAPVKFLITRHHFNPINFNFLYRWAMNRTTKMIAVSRAVQANLQLAFPALDNRIVVIPNWIVLQNIATVSKDAARAALGITRPLTVGIIGQITPIKGHDVVLSALQLLRTNLVEIELPEFVIVGAAHSKEDQAYEKLLRQSAADFVAKKIVNFVGFVPDIAAKLAALDFVIVPSINEGFSIVTLEAMAAGCVVIASDVGAIGELIQHESNGILFPAGDSQSLAQKLAYLLVNEAQRRLISHAAREFAEENFDRELIINKIELIYLAK